MKTVRFYFSFRSPFAWLAFLQAPRALESLPVDLERIPLFPPPDYPNDPAAVPAKLEYIAQHDLPRLARAYGLEVAPLASMDIDWMRPHAMWIYADQHEAGDAFGQELFSARFSRSQDLADERVLAAAARAAGLDPEKALAAGQDPTYHAHVGKGIAKALEDGVFGVPFFTYQGERFWGHDRLGWLVRSICEDAGLELPPLEPWA